MVEVKTKVFKVEGITYSFKKDTGYIFGYPYSSTHVSPYDDDVLREFQRQAAYKARYQDAMRDITIEAISHLPLSKIEAIAKIIKSE